MVLIGKSQRQFGRIGVLMGGVSLERRASFESGRAVYNCLKRAGFDVCGFDLKTEHIKENIVLLKSRRIDCAFLALHGRFGEDGGIQKILEMLEIPYTGSGVLASRLAMDKVSSRKIFEAGGLKVPKYIVLDKDSSRNKRIDLLGLRRPLVVKPATQGSSIGITFIEREKELQKGVDFAFRFDDKILIEEYVKGREVTIGILGDGALPVLEIMHRTALFSYGAKNKEKQTKPMAEEKLTRKLQHDAIKAYNLLGCFGCSRVDMILDEDNAPFILELNSIPGFTSDGLFSKAARAAGIEFNQMCLKLIETAYKRINLKAGQ